MQLVHGYQSFGLLGPPFRGFHVTCREDGDPYLCLRGTLTVLRVRGFSDAAMLPLLDAGWDTPPTSSIAGVQRCGVVASYF